MQAAIDVGVHDIDQGADRLGAGFQIPQDLHLAGMPVFDIGFQKNVGVFDSRTVRRPEPVESPPADAIELFDILAHMPVGWRDDAGRPSHDVIAAEEDILLAERITDVVRGMAGRVQRLDRPVGSAKNVAVCQPPVGPECGVVAGLEPEFAARRCMSRRAEPVHACTKAPGDRVGERRMVEMMVGDEDMRDTLSRQCREDRVLVFLQHRSGIDHRHLSMADDEGIRARPGERTGIAGDDTADSR